jgi:hypothetical protein
MFRYLFIIMAVFMSLHVQAKTFFNAPEVIHPEDENYQDLD